MEKITLCGSTRFKKEYELINRLLTMQGNLIYSVAFFGHLDCLTLSKEDKEHLDRMHKLKIVHSDAIFVINVGGYIGDSTKSEIEYALGIRKEVRYLSDHPEIKKAIDRMSEGMNPT